MASLNPMQLMLMLKNNNPKDVALQLIEQNFANDPLAKQLIEMGMNNNTAGLETLATDILSKRGLKFSDEMNALMEAVKHM